MAYSEIPQSYIDGIDVPRDFGQKTRDNFIAHENRVTTLETTTDNSAHWYQGSSQSITDNVIQKLSFDTVDGESGVTLSNDTDFVFSETGIWLLYLGIRFDTTRSDWVRMVAWFGLSSDNTTRFGFCMFGQGLNGVQSPGASVSIPVTVNTIDYSLSAWVYQDNTSNESIDTMTTYNSTEVYANRIG